MRRWVAEHPGSGDQGRQLWQAAEEAGVTHHSWQSMQNRWRRYLKRGADVAAAVPPAAEASSAEPRPPAARRSKRSSLVRNPRVSAQRRRLAPPRAQKAKRWKSLFERGSQNLRTEGQALEDGQAPVAGSQKLLELADEDAASSAALVHESSSVAERHPSGAKRACVEPSPAESDVSASPTRRQLFPHESASCDELLVPGELDRILQTAPRWLREGQLDANIDPEEL